MGAFGGLSTRQLVLPALPAWKERRKEAIVKKMDDDDDDNNNSVVTVIN